MKALFLLPELSGYFYNGIQCLLSNKNISKVLVVKNSESDLAPYDIRGDKNLEIIFSKSADYGGKLDKQINFFKPDIIYVSGWAHPDYLNICKKFEKRVPIIMGLDNQWRGTIKQLIGSAYFRLFIKKYIKYIWIAGNPQYKFAKMLGFYDSHIFYNLYSANTHLFNEVGLTSLRHKMESYPKTIVFVGRLVEDKGLDLLYDVFKDFHAKNPDWKLKLIGRGPLKSQFESLDGVEILDFIQPDHLPSAIAECGIFCLPSRFENWGVVLHEAVSCCLPVVVSSECGAATEFVQVDLNGYVFASENKAEFYECLMKIANLTNTRLVKMAQASLEISQRITPEIWARTFENALKE